VGKPLRAPEEAAAYAGSAVERDDPALRATAVFDELIQRFSLEVPQLTKDPLGFFADQLRTSLLGDQADEPENDVYAIRSVIERLGRLKEQAIELSKLELKFESFRNAVRQSDHRQAIRLANWIPLRHLAVEELRELTSALADEASALSDNSEDELKRYDRIVAAVERLEQLGQNDPTMRHRAARALFYKGFTLGILKRSEEEIGVYDEVVRRFGEDTQPGVRELVAKALVSKGFALAASNRSEDAIGAYDEVVRRFGEDTQPGVRQEVTIALFNKGNRLRALKRSPGAIGIYDEAVRRFGDATEPALPEPVAKALVNKGVALGALNRSEDAIRVYDQVVRRLGDAREPAWRELVASALLNKGVALGDLNRNEDAISTYDEVIRRFGDVTEPWLREQVAKAKAAKKMLSRKPRKV
jgi:tetratricopeptide (TPR) repeat protein